jgi:hypothetical protein
MILASLPGHAGDCQPLAANAAQEELASSESCVLTANGGNSGGDAGGGDGGLGGGDGGTGGCGGGGSEGGDMCTPQMTKPAAVELPSVCHLMIPSLGTKTLLMDSGPVWGGIRYSMPPMVR